VKRAIHSCTEPPSMTQVHNVESENRDQPQKEPQPCPLLRAIHSTSYSGHTTKPQRLKPHAQHDTQAHTLSHTHTDTLLHMHMHIHTEAHVHTHARAHIQKHAYTQHIHTHTRTHTHTHTHTHKRREQHMALPTSRPTQHSQFLSKLPPVLSLP